MRAKTIKGLGRRARQGRRSLALDGIVETEQTVLATALQVPPNHSRYGTPLNKQTLTERVQCEASCQKPT
jgi:hypothetical protein